MKSAIGWIVVLVLVGYAMAQVAGIVQVRSALGQRAEHYLDFVDEKALEQVREDLVRDAQKLGVKLAPAAIRIVYEDTDKRSVAQYATRKIAEFRNKHVAISVAYDAPLLGFQWRQEITRSKIKQVQAISRSRSELEQAVESAPRF